MANNMFRFKIKARKLINHIEEMHYRKLGYKIREMQGSRISNKACYFSAICKLFLIKIWQF